MSIPTTPPLPRHVAVIMDGNGRWAKKRGRPHVFGHRAGLAAAKSLLTACVKLHIPALTLFAFSSENWSRPAREVEQLMRLFRGTFERDMHAFHEQQVQLKFIGDLGRFDIRLQRSIARIEKLTEENKGLRCRIAVNYGGRWDILNAVRKMMVLERGDPSCPLPPCGGGLGWGVDNQIGRSDSSVSVESDRIKPTASLFVGCSETRSRPTVCCGEQLHDNSLEQKFNSFLSLSDLPEPDLFIRTGGEKRLSNFLLWQLAYTELFFTDILWPDFTAEEFDKILAEFSKRERRFGLTSEQVGRPFHV